MIYMAKTQSILCSILIFTLLGSLAGSLNMLVAPISRAADISVINLDDSGAGSLRQAITDANTNPGADTITFTTAGTITLLSALPNITESLTIDATAPVQAGANIVLDATGFTAGLRFQTGSSHIVKGIGILNANRGIYIETGVTGITIGSTDSEGAVEINGCSQSAIINAGGDNVTIQNSYLGTLSANGIGIEVNGSGSGLTIGGSGSNQRNYISGNNTLGISIADTSTVSIKGNYIGVTTAGTAALANGQDGIYLNSGVTTAAIGGSGADANTISGNTHHGINIKSGNTGVEIYGNYIGTNYDGTASIGNGESGIVIESNGVTVGNSADALKANIISSNGSYGIKIENANSNTISGNKIGTNASGGSDGVTANTLNGVMISGTSASNNISANTIRVATGKSGIVLSGGNGNTARQNNFINCSSLIELLAGNDGLFPPSLSTILSSLVSGTSTDAPSGIVDIYVDGTWTTSVTADASGNFSKSASYSGTNVFVSATNAGNSTSGTSTGPITADITPPSIPVISNTATGTNQTTVTLTGTKEANSNIWVNGAQATAFDATTIWGTLALALSEGANSFSVTSKDGAGNTSTAAIYSITKDTGIPGTPVLSAPSSAVESTATITGSGTEAGATVYQNGTATSTVVDGTGGFTLSVSVVDGPNTFSIKTVDVGGNESPTANITIQKNSGGTMMISSSSHSHSRIDTEEDNDVEDNTEENVEDQTAEDITDTSEDTSTETSEDTSDNTIVEQNSQNTESSTQETVKTDFVENIVKVVVRIKTETESLRENLPDKPAIDPKFDQALFTSDILGEQTNGIPVELLQITFGDTTVDLNADSDHDGLLNGEEILYGGDPYKKDTDNDGFTDFEEVFFKGTDPSFYDSDGDGISDSADQNPTVYNNPTITVPPEKITSYIADNKIAAPLGTIDSDNDGLNDLEELYFGTDPKSDDSDSDGLKDGDERTFYGTDPLTKNDPASISLQITNIKNKETVSTGEQFLMGSAPSGETVKIYSINANKEIKVIGETTADEYGRYIVLTEKISDGIQKIVAVSGNITDNDWKISAVSGTYTLKVNKQVTEPTYMGFDPQGDLSTTNRAPALELMANEKQKIVVVWRSAILSQTLIADSSGQTITAKPVENLELGKHTVTWYAINLENGSKSAPTQMDFSIVNTAFMSGDNGNNRIVIILGALTALLAISTLTLLIRRRKRKS